MQEEQKKLHATLPERLRLILRLMNVTQEELGRIAGVQRTTLTNWLAGKGAPTAVSLEAWVREFNLNGHWLLTGDGEMLAGVAPGGMSPFERELVFFEKRMKDLGASPDEIRRGFLAIAESRRLQGD